MHTTKNQVRAALCDSFDTPKAVSALSTLVVATNTYVQQPEAGIKVPLVRQVSKFIFKILKDFGVYEEEDMPSEAGVGGEEAITPLMNALSVFRDTVKQQANEGPKTMFQLSD